MKAPFQIKSFAARRYISRTAAGRFLVRQRVLVKRKIAADITAWRSTRLMGVRYPLLNDLNPLKPLSAPRENRNRRT